ncbi:hypothetical protein Goshw_026792, partial [Gossypium schwendimanii]|nr:hypothetical protein [Gossypium schwendimanii]
KNSVLTPLPRFFGNGNALETSSQNAKSVSVHPMPLDSINRMHGLADPSLPPSSGARDASLNNVSLLFRISDPKDSGVPLPFWRNKKNMMNPLTDNA